MRYIPAVAALIFLCLSASAVERVYVAVDTVTETVTFPVDSAALSVTFEARVAVGRKPWRFTGNRWCVAVEPKDVYADMLLCEPSVTISVIVGDSVVARRGFTEGFNAAEGSYNSVAVTLGRDSTLTVRGGGNVMSLLVDGVKAGGALDSDCRLESDRPMKVAVAVTETVDDPARALYTGLTPELIGARLLTSTDPVEGIWEFLDRENDPVRARPGGRYCVALLADGSGGYDIIYMGGAEVNRDAWKPGMLKGHLSPTPFVGQYDLMWVDAMMKPIENDISATIEEALMTLGFPLLKSRMRFSRRLGDN